MKNNKDVQTTGEVHIELLEEVQRAGEVREPLVGHDVDPVSHAGELPPTREARARETSQEKSPFPDVASTPAPWKEPETKVEFIQKMDEVYHRIIQLGDIIEPSMPPKPTPRPNNVEVTTKSRAEISLEIFKEKLQETKLSIEKLGHIKEEEEKPSNLPMFKSTRSPKNVTVNQPTRSAKIKTNVTVPQEVEPKGLTRSRTSLERHEICNLKNSKNSEFSKTKILKKWNETKQNSIRKQIRSFKKFKI